MNEELRASIAEALAAAGLTGFRDTTTGMRPQWSASFSHRGHLQGERCYAHIYVPAGTDQLQVNCTAPSPALDSMPVERFQSEIAAIDDALAPGSPQWTQLVDGLEVAPADVAQWATMIAPHQGLEHRMVLARITLPLSALSAGALDRAVRLGLSLARSAREALTANWSEGTLEAE